MAAIEGRVAKPERRWGCRRGAAKYQGIQPTPNFSRYSWGSCFMVYLIQQGR